MGKRKGHNWKARENKETIIDSSEETKIFIEIEGVNQDGNDESNPLVLPAKKRKTKEKIKEAAAPPKKLSKKERKRLEKVISVKEKKEKRAAILQSLAECQATKDELKLMTSTSEIHSGKPMKEVQIEKLASGELKVNAIGGSNKKRKTRDSPPAEDVSTSTDESSEEEDDNTDEDESMNSENQNDHDEKPVIPSECIDDKSKDAHIQSKSNEKLKGTETPNHEKEYESKTVSTAPAVFVPVSRNPEIQAMRLRLPILAEEQSIMETINESQVVVLCGETGSGKTTQVPQFLYEAGFTSDGAMIGVTEPRRVAAISMSNRVGEEMNLTSKEVSYQIRYEGNVTKDTKIRFMTDGVLLKEVQKDFLLSKYKVIIIDEAHERSVYTDILIGLLSRIVPLRHKNGHPLKLVIMSATLRVEDFTENRRLFPKPPPVIKIDARQFPVTIHFNKRTPVDDYLGETYKKICKVHRMLPEGGILVFVTGQQEVLTLCQKLRKTFPSLVKKTDSTGESEQPKTADESSTKPVLPKIDLDSYSIMPEDEEADLDLDTHHDEEEDEAENEDENIHDDEEDSSLKAIDMKNPLYVLPLYSLLSSDKQAKVFKPPPEGSRLCVVATNVAETSLTIPNIKYVIDTGKVKTKFYDKVTGVSTFKITWTSKASANQRAGRAGRTGPGHCYRLYSSAVFNDEFQLFSEAEITRRPVDDLILQMKAMNIEKVINFPYPTPPSEEALMAAENLLVSLGALERLKMPSTTQLSLLKEKKLKSDPGTKLTALGRSMSHFPVSPRFGKMLALGHQQNLLPYVVAIVAALSVQEVLIEVNKPSTSDVENDDLKMKRQHITQIRKVWSGSGHSQMLGDPMVILKAVGACEYGGMTEKFCRVHGIRIKAMKEVRKLRAQLTNVVNAVIPDANLVVDPKMPPPTDLQSKLLRQIILAGLVDHVAIKLPEPLSGTSEEKKKMKFAYQCMDLEEPVFIHPSSVLYKKQPQFIVYQEIVETSKLYMKGITVVEAEWLPELAPSHCQFSKPLEDPPPRYNTSTDSVVCHMKASYGRCNWSLPTVELDYPKCIEKYKWFGKALLDGEVIQEFGRYKSLLLSLPVTMIKSWAKLQPRTETLLRALIEEDCSSKNMLLNIWRNKPNYLLSEFLTWIPEAHHSDVRKQWPLASS
ncbi:putative ATP-dependent RNA helicase DHX37 [Tubulanus polymorphus]|uniref:putative ATP-dependent RNA helicase DHX37 n=1 Tax=Tubulanus polymorphus TaxID=672921 RepID=UPI003DA5A655